MKFYRPTSAFLSGQFETVINRACLPDWKFVSNELLRCSITYVPLPNRLFLAFAGSRSLWFRGFGCISELPAKTRDFGAVTLSSDAKIPSKASHFPRRHMDPFNPAFGADVPTAGPEFAPELHHGRTPAGLYEGCVRYVGGDRRAGSGVRVGSMTWRKMLAWNALCWPVRRFGSGFVFLAHHSRLSSYNALLRLTTCDISMGTCAMYCRIRPS